MLTIDEYLVNKLAEEAVEVAQRCTKIMSFGMHEKQPGQDLDNLRRLKEEVNDFLGTLEFMERALDLPKFRDEAMIAAKKEKIVKYAEYSIEIGRLASL